MTDDKYFAYFAVKKRDGQRTNTFAIGDEKFTNDALHSWEAGEVGPADTSQEPEAPEPDFTHESSLTEALSRAVDFGLSQYQLISVAGVTPAFFSNSIAREHVINPTIEAGIVLKEEDAGLLIGLTEDQYFAIKERRDLLVQMRAGVEALPSATLMSIVSTFDTLIVDIVGKMLRLDKKWLEKSDRTLSFARLASAANIDELVDDAIVDEVYQFSRGSHDEQAKYIETKFGVGIKKYWKRWPDYIEVFERRNLIAHGERLFNKRYVEICSAAGHKGSAKVLGTPVELSSSYLNQALDVLLEFSILLPFSLWRKVAKDKEAQAFENLNEAAFKLISNERHVPAERILEFALGLEKAVISQEIRQMLVVNRASALRHSGKEDKAVEVLDSVDWSGSSDLFKLCVASVRADSAGVVKLMPAVKGAGALNARSFKQWPCFAFVHEDASVRTTFEEVFGEPLAAAASGAAVRESVDHRDDSADAEAAGTVH